MKLGSGVSVPIPGSLSAVVLRGEGGDKPVWGGEMAGRAIRGDDVCLHDVSFL